MFFFSTALLFFKKNCSLCFFFKMGKYFVWETVESHANDDCPMNLTLPMRIHCPSWALKCLKSIIGVSLCLSDKELGDIGPGFGKNLFIEIWFQSVTAALVWCPESITEEPTSNQIQCFSCNPGKWRHCIAGEIWMLVHTFCANQFILIPGWKSGGHGFLLLSGVLYGMM